MNISSMSRSSRLVAALITAAFALFSAEAAHAQILLTIDDSDITHTVISFTGAAPLTSATPFSESIGTGIDLLGLFKSTVNFDQFSPTAMTLSTGDASEGPIFNLVYGDDASSSSSNVDLSIFGTGGKTITFTAGEAAFSGSMTFDMTGRNLASVGTTGAIVTGYSRTANTQIGEWQVVNGTSVPEPSTWALLLGSLAALPVLLRRRRS